MCILAAFSQAEAEVSNMPTCSSRLLVPSLRHANPKGRWWEQESLCWICFIVVQGNYTQCFNWKNWGSVSPRDTTWWQIRHSSTHSGTDCCFVPFCQWHLERDGIKGQFDEQLTTDVQLLQNQTKLWMTIGVSKCPWHPMLSPAGQWFCLLVLECCRSRTWNDFSYILYMYNFNIYSIYIYIHAICTSLCVV